MSPQHLSVAQAYACLGLEEGSTLETVKSAYKQKALSTHPDKNPDDPDATAEFQRVSEAYRTLSKHLERASRNTYDSAGYSSDEYDSDDDYSSDDMADMYYFYEKLFEMFMRGERHSHMRYRRVPRVPEESDEQVQERVRRMCDEQQQAEERRKRESATRKQNAEKEREKERVAAGERQKVKVESKRARALSQREKAEQTARTLQKRIQSTRSAVFSAARAGDAAAVKRGVWEDAVDADGPETKVGCEGFVETTSLDPKETLLHIAVKNGDSGLVGWLNTHGAEPSEKNSEQLNPFHLSLLHGQIAIATYFFEEYPPCDDTANIYNSPASRSLLLLALDSCEPELVWMILDKGLASSQEIIEAWNHFTSKDGILAWRAPNRKAPAREIVEDIAKLLARYGGFTQTPAPLLKSATQPKTAPHPNSRTEPLQTTYVENTGRRGSNRGRSRGGRSRGRGRGWVPPTTAAR
ncbi:DnaJ domain-containing protein [Collybia nuda]|uniref:DnaJ domain-containing protein n=1 Tax=Collybia nuda TaxID=64659 RepID=A0A9P5YH50_9AGAR|nr:DnaJ domain-containing protein [Collybia nuda]